MCNLLRFVRESLVIVAISLTAVAQANRPLKSTPSPMDLTVSTDRQTYRMSETIKMKTRLLNTGNEDVYIWGWDLCWNPARGLSMYVKTPDGSAVHGDFLFDCVPPPPKEGNVYQFVKLAPGRFYGLADDIKVSDIVSKPGEYDIDVTYNSFISRSFIKEFLAHDPISKFPVWTMEEPTITAPRIHITVER